MENEAEFKHALGFNNDFMSFLKSNKTKSSEKGVIVFDSFDAARSEEALTKKRRKWFVGIWDYPIDLSQKISTA